MSICDPLSSGWNLPLHLPPLASPHSTQQAMCLVCQQQVASAAAAAAAAAAATAAAAAQLVSVPEGMGVGVGAGCAPLEVLSPVLVGVRCVAAAAAAVAAAVAARFLVRTRHRNLVLLQHSDS